MTLTADALAERLFSSVVASFDVAGVYLGDRLGWYASLADDGPATPEELAARTGSDARYAREWLEQQAVSGILEVDGDHRFSLPAPHAEVLVHPTSMTLMAPISRMVAAAFGRLPALADAYRSGEGLGWEQYGPDMREGQATFNRPAFTHLLGQEWLPATGDLHERLQSDPPARVVDIGCGEGWSTIAMAQAYPKATFVGIDLDQPSIEAARRHAREAGVESRVTFHHDDAAGLAGSFDAAIIIEALHDMANPVPVLRNVGASLVEGGTIIVVDEKVGERFSAPGDDLERFMYGWSITTCLPDGRSREPSWPPAPSCGPTRFGRMRARPASSALRSCRSRTTSSASTAWRGSTEQASETSGPGTGAARFRCVGVRRSRGRSAR